MRCISSRLPLSLNRAQYELPDRFSLVGLDKEAVVIFIEKYSIQLKCLTLLAYGILKEIVDAIKITLLQKLLPQMV